MQNFLRSILLITALSFISIPISQSVSFAQKQMLLGPQINETGNSGNENKLTDDKVDTDDSPQSPSEWLQSANFHMNELIVPALTGFDTTQWDERFD
jgi:hypothetical protein